MRTTDTSLWMSFDFPSVPIPRAQSRFYSSDCNLFPTVNPPSSTQGKNKQTKPENLYTVVKWLKKNTKQLYKLQNCLFSLPPWGWYSWFWTLRGKPQTKKKALHLELEWVKLAHFCHEFCQICWKFTHTLITLPYKILGPNIKWCLVNTHRAMIQDITYFWFCLQSTMRYWP